MEQILINYTKTEDSFNLSVVTKNTAYSSSSHDEKNDAIIAHLKAIEEIISED
ncbi:MAG: hypothetical protein II663_06330 [Bacteroidales bacterium]|nr:hypothetical protein [Bacteroidales bacterium]